MRKVINDCGSKTPFGYYDVYAHEIVIRRPNLKKKDVAEAIQWVEDCPDLRKFSIVLTPAIAFCNDCGNNALYLTARAAAQEQISANGAMDALLLTKLLPLLETKNKLTSLTLRCLIFKGDEALFSLLCNTIRNINELVYLDLSGCFFDDRQLVKLAEVLAQTSVAHLVWPDALVSDEVEEQVAEKLASDTNLIVVSNAPKELRSVASKNRKIFLRFGECPEEITDEIVYFLRQHKQSLILALAYEKDRLCQVEKTLMSIIDGPNFGTFGSNGTNDGSSPNALMVEEEDEDLIS